MRAKDVMKILKISRTTLYNYTKQGIISYTKLDNGYYDYHEDSVLKILKKDARINVIYSRVSTFKQKNDLHAQTTLVKKFCKMKDIQIDSIYSEISSGLDFDRKEFSRLFEDVINLKIKTVYITNKDRLTRLSFKTIKYIFSKFHTDIVVINDDPNESNDVEIFEELISLIHIFSTTMYSNRRKNKMKIISNDIENFIS